MLYCVIICAASALVLAWAADELTPEEFARRAAWFEAYCRAIDERSVFEPPVEGLRYACPCCHHFTLKERGSYDICSVCFWEDDGQDDPYADDIRGGPNRGLSLTQARINYAAMGAVETRLLPHVREPRPEELGNGDRQKRIS